MFQISKGSSQESKVVQYMPLVQTGNMQTYYEIHGNSGPFIVFILGAGHESNLENPEVFNREIEDFLRDRIVSIV